MKPKIVKLREGPFAGLWCFVQPVESGLIPVLADSFQALVAAIPRIITYQTEEPWQLMI